MRPRGDLSAQSSTTNSRSAVVGKGEVLAFYVGDVVGEYKLLHWSECLAACSLYSEAGPVWLELLAEAGSDRLSSSTLRSLNAA